MRRRRLEPTPHTEVIDNHLLRLSMGPDVIEVLATLGYINLLFEWLARDLLLPDNIIDVLGGSREIPALDVLQQVEPVPGTTGVTEICPTTFLVIEPEPVSTPADRADCVLPG